MSQEETAQKNEPIRHRIVTATVQFDFALPPDMPKENGEEYAKEKLKNLCDKINHIRGVKVSYTL